MDNLKRQENTEEFKKNQLKLIIENREHRRKSRMKKAVVFFVLAAVAVSSILYVIFLKHQMIENANEVIHLEDTLEKTRSDNDEQYRRLTESVDLEEIRRIAIGDLGMQYADPSQIVTYEGEEAEYVQQVGEIPEETEK